MSGAASYPPRVLISLCTSLALSTVDRPERQILLDALAEVLPHCDGCTGSVARVRRSAELLLSAKTPRSETLQEIDLRQAVQRHHQLVGFAALEDWRDQQGER